MLRILLFLILFILFMLLFNIGRVINRFIKAVDLNKKNASSSHGEKKKQHSSQKKDIELDKDQYHVE
jgi:Na+-transporting methylmalonyl-CoA/oxaloacetate decarboxylase gamma subunit